MKASAIVTSAAMLALVSGAASTSPRQTISGSSTWQSRSAPRPPIVTLLNQNSRFAAAYLDSQNYPPKHDDSDNETADDFVVPSGHVWSITRIDVSGFYGAGGPAPSVNVRFYSGGDVPSRVLVQCLRLDGGPGPNFVVSLKDSLCSAPTRFKEGHYWVSVQVNMSQTRGLWFWDLRQPIAGFSVVYRNPGNALKSGCVDWTHDCGFSEAYDAMFALRGVDTF